MKAHEHALSLSGRPAGVESLETRVTRPPVSGSRTDTARRRSDKPPKPRPILLPTMNADQAVIVIGRQLLGTLVDAEEGVRNDRHPEYLHSYRVACRRTRSLISQLGRVFPSEIRDHYRREYKWLGKVTGPLRDLDVHLLQIVDHRNTLDAALPEDLAPLDEYLRRQRDAEHRRLMNAMGSSRYRDLTDGWREYLQTPADGRIVTAVGQRPATEVASERIWHAYRRLTRRGGDVTADSASELLHEMRIDCKKLRYLLEQFSSLYDSSAIRPLVKSLKRLQDDLGRFNDLQVQKTALRKFARDMLKEGTDSADCLLMMGRLVEHCDRRQRKARRGISASFARFDAPGSRQRFRQLFQA